MKFSVLMAVYRGTDAQQLRDCLESLAAQTVQATELVLVEDGPLQNGVYPVIESFRSGLNIVTLKLDKNEGLANALNAGLKTCSHAWVARMDSDDICHPERFAEQTKILKTSPDLDVLGTWVEERDMNMDVVLSIRKTPETNAEILEFSKSRNPISHPTVFFRKAKVLEFGGYPDIYPEDYPLWCIMLNGGCRFQNVEKPLVYMRTEQDFYARRGLKFLQGELKSYFLLWRIGHITFARFVLNSCQRTVVRLAPASVKKFLYKKFR